MVRAAPRPDGAVGPSRQRALPLP